MVALEGRKFLPCGFLLSLSPTYVHIQRLSSRVNFVNCGPVRASACASESIAHIASTKETSKTPYSDEMTASQLRVSLVLTGTCPCLAVPLAISEDSLISPLMSLVFIIMLVIAISWGSNFFGRMKQVPIQAWDVLKIVQGDLFDAVRQESYASELTLGGLRGLIAMSADPDASTQCRAASCLSILLEQALNDASHHPRAHIEAVVALAERYTMQNPERSAHAALGIANAALSCAQHGCLLELGALNTLIRLSKATRNGHAQSAIALSLALLAQSPAARDAILRVGLDALATLLCSKNSNAVRQDQKKKWKVQRFLKERGVSVSSPIRPHHQTHTHS